MCSPHLFEERTLSIGIVLDILLCCQYVFVVNYFRIEDETNSLRCVSSIMLLLCKVSQV